MRIAIVEDNKPIADGIAQAFTAEGHGVDQIHDGNLAEDFLKQETFDLIILDINLPGQSGLDILKSLREQQIQTPVLILTARNTLDEKIDGLDLGADDYLTKPFDLAELKARSRALMRRSNKDIKQVITVGQLELNLSGRQIKLKGDDLNLPRREFALAEILITRIGHVISKEQIISHLYGSGSEVEDSTVELYVHRLRKKFKDSKLEIKTVRGLGYCLLEKK